MVAAKKKVAGLASQDPDNMISAGLADDFDGEITKVRFVPWNYDGSLDHHVLAARVTIQPDEDSGFDEFDQYYSAGNLEFFVPSDDEGNPVDLDSWDGDDIEEVEGTCALRVGRREQLNNNTNWAHFLSTAIASGLPKSTLSADISFLEGVRGHFNRIPQEKRSGIQVVAEGDRVKTILVLTEVEKAKGKSKGKTASTRGTANDIDEKLAPVILTALAEAGDDGVSKAKLPSLVIGSFKGKERAAAVKRVSEADFLKSGDWEYDADEGVLSLG